MSSDNHNGHEKNHVDIDSADDNNDESKEPFVKIVTGKKAEKYLIYGVNSTPPIHITVICALQQALLSLSGQLIVSLLVAEAVCASENNVFKARLLSSTLFMSGVTTVAMNLFGTRLPLFQGASSTYIIPLLLVANIDGDFCSSESAARSYFNGTENSTVRGFPMEKILNNVRAMQGSLMIAGVVHAFLGFTGLVGFLLKFVGPLTIVPALVLIFIFIVKPVLKFVEVNWGIAISTIVVAVILFLYLGKHDMPIPIWTPSGGCRVIRYPLHQVFAILISILINWMICGILTRYDVIPNDPDHYSYKARTDARIDVIENNPWITLPYPGQYGAFGFSGAAFLAFMIATFMSVLDSIGDYYACAKVCRVPPPPKHAVNRGILIEGVCSFLSGTVGCGHATSTYGGNIGAIGVTKVASRQVFIGTGILYILFGVFGKFSAVFITLPYPVLGGAIVVMFGIFFGVVISNLEVTNMSSPRNMAIVGLSIFIGLSVPTWAQKEEKPISTGHDQFDKIMSMLLGNPNLIGTILACFLDNTVPGSAKDRGIAAWQVTKEDEAAEIDRTRYNEGYEVFNPLLPETVLKSKLVKFVPFLPFRQRKSDPTSLSV